MGGGRSYVIAERLVERLSSAGARVESRPMPEPLTPGDGQDVLARLKTRLERRDPDARAWRCSAEDAECDPDPFEPSLRGANAIRA